MKRIYYDMLFYNNPAVDTFNQFMSELNIAFKNNRCSISEFKEITVKRLQILYPEHSIEDIEKEYIKVCEDFNVF